MTPINAPEGLIKMIRQDEGFRNRTYIDSEGFETLGIGLCLEKSPLPEPVALYWCGYILDKICARLSTNQSIGQTYTKLDEPRQWAIANMAYQMGVSGVCGFLDMWAALDKKNYPQAAAAALDSVWAYQTRSRRNGSRR